MKNYTTIGSYNDTIYILNTFEDNIDSYVKINILKKFLKLQSNSRSLNICIVV